MVKTTLDVVGKGYRSIGFCHTCPCCLRANTYYSCTEMAWVCYDCGEVFPTPKSIVSPTHHRPTQIRVEPMVAGFNDLRTRLRGQGG